MKINPKYIELMEMYSSYLAEILREREQVTLKLFKKHDMYTSFETDVLDPIDKSPWIVNLAADGTDYYRSQRYGGNFSWVPVLLSGDLEK